MKGILITLCFLLSINAIAQSSYVAEINNFRGKNIDINSEFGDVILRTQPNDNIKIEIESNNKSIELKEFYNIDIENNNNGFSLSTSLKSKKKRKNNNLEIKIYVFVPQNLNHHINVDFGSLEMYGKFSECNINVEFGDVNIFFTENPRHKLFLNSDFGDVNVTMAEECRASIIIDQVFGKVYSDLPLVITTSMVGMFDGNYHYTLNEGGNEIEIISQFGDIKLLSY